MNRKLAKTIVFLFIILYSLFFIQPAWAAELELVLPKSEIAVGERIEAGLFLDTEGKVINALDGEISLSNDNLLIVGVSEVNSFVSLWVVRPAIVRQIASFAGIIPGGFRGTLQPNSNVYSKGKIIDLVVEGRQSGQTVINGSLSRLVLHDGEGTLLEVVGVNKIVSIKPADETVVPQEDKLFDTEPPEDFKPLIIKSEFVYDNKYSLVFYTRDNGSGVDHYEVKEGGSQFELAESPYLLENQALNEAILVKAIDRAGNEKIAAVELPESSWFDFTGKWWIILVLLAVGSVVIYRWRKASRKHYLGTARRQ